MITICHQAARETGVLTIRQSLADTRAADARLARASWVNLHQLPTGAFSLVREFVDEGCPSGIVDVLSQYPAGQSLDVQVFDGDQPVAVDELTRQFVVKVGSSVKQSTSAQRKQCNRLAPSVATFDSPGDPSLTTASLGLRVPLVAGVLNSSSVTQRGELGEPNVDTNSFRRVRERFIGHVSGDTREPFTALALDRRGLGCADEWPMHLDLDRPDFRQDEAGSNPESFLSKRQGIEASSRAEARIARSVAALTTPIEGIECPVQSPQRAFQHMPVDCGYVGPVGPNVRQLGGLVEEVYPRSMTTPRIASFLKRRVIQLAANAKMGFQNLALCVRRIEPITIGSQRHLQLYFTAAEAQG